MAELKFALRVRSGRLAPQRQIVGRVQVCQRPSISIERRELVIGDEARLQAFYRGATVRSPASSAAESSAAASRAYMAHSGCHRPSLTGTTARAERASVARYSTNGAVNGVARQHEHAIGRGGQSAP